MATRINQLPIATGTTSDDYILIMDDPLGAAITKAVPVSGLNVSSGGGGTGTVTNVSALTIGTTGTDISSTVANSTTTPVITLNIPTASGSARGVLASGDWTTFNNKQAALTNPVTGVGVSGYLTKWTSTSGVSSGVIYDTGTNIGIGTTNPLTFIVVSGATSAANHQMTFFQSPGIPTRTYIGAGGSDTRPFLASVGSTLNSASDNGWGLFDRNSDGNFALRRKNSSDWNDVLNITRASGYVGLGTNTPFRTLDVRGGVYVSGNLGIGTPSPISQLQVVGTGILSSGIVGRTSPIVVNDVTNITPTLTVSGVVIFAGNTVYYSGVDGYFIKVYDTTNALGSVNGPQWYTGFNGTVGSYSFVNGICVAALG